MSPVGLPYKMSNHEVEDLVMGKTDGVSGGRGRGTTCKEELKERRVSIEVGFMYLLKLQHLLPVCGNHERSHRGRQ